MMLIVGFISLDNNTTEKLLSYSSAALGIVVESPQVRSTEDLQRKARPRTTGERHKILMPQGLYKLLVQQRCYLKRVMAIATLFYPFYAVHRIS